MNLKEDYERLKKKYNLPSYEELDSEFELLYMPAIQEIKFPLRFIRRKICDKVGGYLGYLQSILQPNPNSVINMQESEFLSDEKEKIMLLIRELIPINATSTLRELEQDEKLDAEFIKNNFKNWMEIKKEIMNLVEKSVRKWREKVKEDKGKEKYFG